jgi:hypothetical protein
MNDTTDKWDTDPIVASSSQDRWWIRFCVWNFFREESFVAKVYADSLRDNFLDYDLDDKQKIADLRSLKAAFNEEYASRSPRLDVFLKIEAHLTLILPPHVTGRRFWAILDRFERVVPEATRAQYWSSVPQRGGPQWEDDKFRVQQARALLDVIHANYIINTARETSTKRLKLMLLAVFLLTTAIILAWFVRSDCPGSWFAYAILAYAGMLGAMMSITQRLQTAVSHDAMVMDGIFELTGLRLGWVGIVMSIFSGGVFALVLYFMVMGGLFAASMPSANPADATTYVQVRQRLIAEIEKKEAELSELAGSTTQTNQGADRTGGSATAAGAPADTSATVPPQSSTAGGNVAKANKISEELRESRASLRYLEGTASAVIVEASTKSPNGRGLATVLGLANGEHFFRMLILAFLAGFAERLVPDILERLRKNASG